MLQEESTSASYMASGRMMDAVAASQLSDSAASGGASRQWLRGQQSSAPAPTRPRGATVPLRWPADPSRQDALGCLSLGGEVASPDPARSPRVAWEVEKRDAGGDAEGEARRSDAFLLVCLAPTSPSNSGCARCMESGRARMGWEVDVSPCAGWLFCLQMQSLGPRQLLLLHLSFITQKAVGFLRGFLHVSGRGEGAGWGTDLPCCCKLCQHEPRKNGQWVFSRIIES